MNIDTEGRPSKRFMLFYPEKFFDKTVNEDFIQTIMQRALQRNDWRSGNADLLEQDRFCGKTPFEFTIASDEKKKNTLQLNNFYQLSHWKVALLLLID